MLTILEWVSSMGREIKSFKDMKVYEECPREESQGKRVEGSSFNQDGCMQLSQIQQRLRNANQRLS
jgi:hypothetical protein